MTRASLTPIVLLAAAAINGPCGSQKDNVAKLIDFNNKLQQQIQVQAQTQLEPQVLVEHVIELKKP